MLQGHVLEISLSIFNIAVAVLIIFTLAYWIYRQKQRSRLSKSQLQKLPKVTGKDLVMGADCCAVCLDEIESNQSARMIPGCNHGFHLQCADAWLAKHATCPICRAQITSEFFRDAPGTNSGVAVVVPGTNPGVAVAV